MLGLSVFARTDVRLGFDRRGEVAAQASLQVGSLQEVMRHQQAGADTSIDLVVDGRSARLGELGESFGSRADDRDSVDLPWFSAKHGVTVRMEHCGSKWGTCTGMGRPT